jgi:glyoxylase-like metal-dependent hydrolase (beta-lactamase superfamily II)
MLVGTMPILKQNLGVRGRTMPDSYKPYEVYAVRYAERDAMHNDHIMNKDPHDGPSPMDYFVWAIVGNGHTIVVDIGFEEKEAKARGRKLLRRPAEGLKAIGIDSTKVEQVVVTHLHYDHSGTVSDFPKAKFYLQEREMHFATGKHMAYKGFSMAYSLDYVFDMIRQVYDNRVVFVDGTAEIAPGVTLHHVGGHTDGLQVVRVPTKRGWVVLASDASHYYMNMRTPNPFPLVYSVGDMVQGYATMEALADSPRHIVPGHDPLVMKEYPAPSKKAKGIAVRLDVAPKKV